MQEKSKHQFYLYKMQQKYPTRDQLIKKSQSFNCRLIQSSSITVVPFDPQLAANPYLHNQQKYQYLVHSMKVFNKGVQGGEEGEGGTVRDNYEVAVQEKLRGLLVMLGNMLNRDLQHQKLSQIYNWFIQEQKLLQQRAKQGEVRYMITKQYLSLGKVHQPGFIQVNEKDKQMVNYHSMLPSDELKLRNLPFVNKWRTTHKELASPDLRLKQYQRKSLNFNMMDISSHRDVIKTPRITYPRIQRARYTKDFQMEETDQPTKNPQNPQVLPQPQPQQPQPQDLGIPQDPAQPDQQSQQPQKQDPLAPRLKAYIHEPIIKPTLQDDVSITRMNDRYLKIYSDRVRKNNQDLQIIALMESWAARKSKIDRDVMKRIEGMGVGYDRYQLMQEQPTKQQQFPLSEAQKYGLSKTTQLKAYKPPHLDLSSPPSLILPNIKNPPIFQKSIKKDKLKNLKKRFNKILDLKQYEERDVAHSMCQIRQRRKGFSEILRQCSKSKERLNQLEEVVVLKEKLAKSKVMVDVAVLSKSMCLPEEEELPQNAYPQKNLPSNPFLIQQKKKKKKA